MRRVEPDPDKMPEQRREPRAVGLGQRRLQNGGDIAAQMLVIAGAEQDDIDTRLVPDEPVNLAPDQRVLIEIKPAPLETATGTAGDLARSEIVGMWADRTDMGDSVEIVNDLRRRIDRREL